MQFRGAGAHSGAADWWIWEKAPNWQQNVLNGQKREGANRTWEQRDLFLISWL
jgi:hypothetical protein